MTDYPVIEDVQYEIAHFDTVPYEDVEEFSLYRKKKELTNVLRTESDWDNARKPERQKNKLEIEMIQDKLDELINDY